MHAFKRLLAHPTVAAGKAVVAAIVQLPMDASETMGRGWLLFLSKGGSRETLWGMRDGEGGKGVESAMLIFYVFFCGGRGVFGCEMWLRVGKLRSDLKNVMAFWSF